jgi:ABC-2 type transport system ATP-binding protein
MLMIEVKDLHKRYGSIRAVDGVSFQAKVADVLGFTGPNGAGKSTTIRMLACFLTPDSGTATIAGHDIVRESVAVRRAVGYLAETAPAYDEMAVLAFLRFICDARGIKGAARKEALEKVCHSCALEEVTHQRIGTLSKGFRRRVGLAQALVHDPQVLLLDEPTDGLDPNQKHDIRNLINKLAAKKCIVISTHILEEVTAICNRMIIIDRGRVVADSTPQELCKRETGSLEDVFRKLTVKAAQPAQAGKGGAA